MLSNIKNTAAPGFGLFFVPVFDAALHDSEDKHFAAIEEQVKYADANGWRNVWLSEHHGTEYGGMLNAPDIFGAYLAAVTKQIRIGPGIAVLPIHNARHLAERYAMLDQLSHGRLDMGIGRGFLEIEFKLFDIDINDSKERFKEAYEILKMAWKDGIVTYQGKFNKYDQAETHPACYKKMPPIWIAASNTKQSFEIAGLNGHNLMINPYTRTEEEIKEGLGTYFAALNDAGFARDEVRVTAMLHLYCGEVSSEVENALNSYVRSLAKAANGATLRPDSTKWQKHFESVCFQNVYPDKVLFGTPEVLTEQLLKWCALGVTDFCLMSQFGTLSWEASMKSVQRFTDEVARNFPSEKIKMSDFNLQKST